MAGTATIISFTWDEGSLSHNTFGPMMQADVDHAVEEAKNEAPVGTGDTAGSLRDSIQGHVDFTSYPPVGVIEATDPKARFVIEGTAPHEIEAVNTQAMSFVPSGGLLLFRKVVNHPGTKPNNFLMRAIQKVLGVGA